MTTTTTAPEPTPAAVPVAPAPAEPTATLSTEVTPEPAAPEPAQAPVVPAVTSTTATASEPAPAPAQAEVAAEPEEPQNALTRKFTDAEWKALKEFKSQIPDILATAFDDSDKAKTTPITLWGVTIDPANLLDAKVSVVLMKFLRARNLNINSTRDMFISTLRWRKSFDVDGACKEEHSAEIFGNAGHIYGKDKEGRPVVYNIYGGNQDLTALFADTQRFLRWRVALMERSIAQLDFETVDQTIQVHDYKGVSLSSRDANAKRAASEASSIFSGHYPELLFRKFFVSVPSLMTWIFWLFKPILPAATLAKMSVVGSGSSSIGRALLPHIDAKELPKQYGGEAEAFW